MASASIITTNSNIQEEDECFGQTMDMMMAGFLPQVLRAVVELGVLEIIAKAESGGLLDSEITSQLTTENPNTSDMLDRMLSLLASQSVLICSVNRGQRRYGLGPRAKFFVKKHGAPFTPILIYTQDKALSDVWHELDGAILKGGEPAFERCHGVPFYDYVTTQSKFGRNFYDSMFNHTKVYMDKLLELDDYKGFQNIKSLVDVGGAYGHAVAAITAKYPHIKGINFDLPTIVQRAPSHPGVEHVGGNMFESIPEADAIFMKWVFHNWDDEHSLRLLKNCYKALPENGKVIIVEHIIPEDINNETGDKNMITKNTLSNDVVMGLIFNTGSKSRRGAEFQAFAKAAGFKGLLFKCCFYNLWLMELHK